MKPSSSFEFPSFFGGKEFFWLPTKSDMHIEPIVIEHSIILGIFLGRILKIS